MKSILSTALFLTLAVSSVQAVAASGTVLVSCEQDPATVANAVKITISSTGFDTVATYDTITIVNGQKQYTQVAQADNVRVAAGVAENQGAKIYSTDMGVYLKVNGAEGFYSGIIPPARMVSAMKMNCTSN